MLLNIRNLQELELPLALCLEAGDLPIVIVFRVLIGESVSSRKSEIIFSGSLMFSVEGAWCLNRLFGIC
jgi:hypothetical protein